MNTHLYKYSESRAQKKRIYSIFSAEAHPIRSKYKKIFYICCFLCSLIVCPAFSAQAQSLSPDYLEYIEIYRDIAVRQQQEYGIPASITLAQGLLESGAGHSRLASEGNNHFGIKCHKDWTGEGIYADDDEKNECFRRYADAEESFEDHARFLKRNRYRPLFELKETDYKGWAKGLKKCGYATDPSYASKLINIIELYELFRYDTGQPIVSKRKHLEGDETLEHSINMDIINEFRIMHKIHRHNGLYCVTAMAGDTYESIAEELGMKEKKLRNYNELDRHVEKPADGEIIYLEELRDEMPEGGKTEHILKKGETLRSVAHFYGLKLKPFCKLNRFDKDDTPRIGTRLRLR